MKETFYQKIKKFNEIFLKELKLSGLSQTNIEYIQHLWKEVMQAFKNIKNKKSLEQSTIICQENSLDTFFKKSQEYEGDLIHESLLQDQLFCQTQENVCNNQKRVLSKNFIKQKQNQRYKFELMPKLEKFIDDATKSYNKLQIKDNILQSDNVYKQNVVLLKKTVKNYQNILKNCQKDQNKLEQKKMKLLAVKEVTGEAKLYLDKILTKFQEDKTENSVEQYEDVQDNEDSDVQQNNKSRFFEDLQNSIDQELSNIDSFVDLMNKNNLQKTYYIFFGSFLCKIFYFAICNLDDFIVQKKRHLETASVDFMQREIKFMTAFMECILYYINTKDQEWQIDFENNFLDCQDIEKYILEKQNESIFISEDGQELFIIFNLLYNMTKCGVKCAYEIDCQQLIYYQLNNVN